MSVRRKSNWYIYFIAFAIAMTFAMVAIFAFRGYLFPEDTAQTGVNASNGGDEYFRPTAEHNFNSMIMLSDKTSDNPELFILVEYNAVDGRIAIIPVPNGISVPPEGRSLPNVYAAQGGGKVVSVIEDIIGIEIDSFVRFDRMGFMRLISSFGNVEYEVVKFMIVYDGAEAETLNVGTHRLTAETIFRLAMFAEYDEGESYRFSNIGQMFADLINQNYRSVDGSMLDNFFDMIMNDTETDLTDKKYTDHRQALLYTIEYSDDPAEYYVPYGEYADNGAFTLAENSIISIRQRAGLA